MPLVADGKAIKDGEEHDAPGVASSSTGPV
jgi:hypothetical protein